MQMSEIEDAHKEELSKMKVVSETLVKQSKQDMEALRSTLLGMHAEREAKLAED